MVHIERGNNFFEKKYSKLHTFDHLRETLWQEKWSKSKTGLKMLRVLVCLLLLGVLVQHNTSVVNKHQDNKDWFNAQVDDKAVESSVPNVSAICPHSSFSHRHFCELCINGWGKVRRQVSWARANSCCHSRTILWNLNLDWYWKQES